MEAKLIKTDKSNYILIDTTKKVYDEGYLLGTSKESLLNRLSLKNCEAIANSYDLDELAEKHYDVHIKQGHTKEDSLQRKIDFTIGFVSALEILGDKKFSEEQMFKMFTYGHALTNAIKLKAIEDKPFGEIFNDFIQSLQQTEWDVEIEMECLTSGSFQIIDWSKNTPKTTGEVPLPCVEERIKLDADGCLILKRK